MYALFMEHKARAQVCNEISTLIYDLNSCVVINDFNKVEFYEDKIGGSHYIRGWHSFMEWRLRTPLLLVDFIRPHFTWFKVRTTRPDHGKTE